MHATSPSSRRAFLQQMGVLSCTGVAAPFALNLAAMSEVAAQQNNDFRALVCVFLYGGNDAFNTVLPTDSDSWRSYVATRRQAPESLVLSRDQLLSIQPGNLPDRTFALHPQLKRLQGLFDAGKLAIVPNVGSLIEPIANKSEFERNSRKMPVKLFSHNDQQTTWQALGPEGAAYGWGGRIADMVASGNGKSLFTSISVSGNAVWLSGQQVTQYQVSTGGPIRLGTLLDAQGRPSVYNNPAVAEALDRIVRSNRSGSVFGDDLAQVAARSIDAEKQLSRSLPPADHANLGAMTEVLMTLPSSGRTVSNPLAEQLRMVGRMLATRQALGLRRQIFFVGLHGFDTHDNQTTQHADLLARLDHGLGMFHGMLQRLGLTESVTTFTASDFGRTFTSNGDGTDHGWGAHHFVMGGGVKGGLMHGRFPVLGARMPNTANQFASDDQLMNGVLLPSQSIEQYGATMGRWFGLTDGQLLEVFPNLSNFSHRKDLGFMNA